MRNKALRPVLISAVVLLLLLAGYFIVSDDNAPINSPEPTPDAQESVTLVEIPIADIAEIDYEPREGLSYTITVLSDEKDGGLNYAFSPEQAGFLYQKNLIAVVAGRLASLSATPLASAEEFNPEDFGLDPPRVRITVRQKDGRKTVLLVGGQNATQSGSFIQIEGVDTLYLVENYIADDLIREETYFRDLAFLPAYPVTQTQDLSFFLSTIKLAGKNAPFAVRLITEEEAIDTSVQMINRFVMVEPMEGYGVSDYYITDVLLTQVAMISPSIVVEDYPDNLTDYGLDAPYTLEIEDYEGVKSTLQIGKEAPDGGRYVMVGGRDAVLLDMAGNYDFLNLRYIDVVSKLIWLHNITDADSVTMELPGGITRVINYSHSKDSDGNDIVGAVLDGKSISETNGKRLYSSILGIALTDEFKETPPAQWEYRFTIHMLDGSSKSMELYKLHERAFAAGLDSNPPSFTVGADTVLAVESNLAIVDSGGEVAW